MFPTDTLFLTGPSGDGLPLTSAADGLDVVAVGVTHEATEVVGVVFGEHPRRVQDLRSDRDGSVMKPSHRGAVGRGEGDVQLPALVVTGRRQPEGRSLAVGAGGPDRPAVGEGRHDPERR